MEFIGDTDHRGTYYFFSDRHNGWIVADLDRRKSELYSKLALVRVTGELDDHPCLGFQDDLILIDYDNLIPLLREYPEDAELLMIYKETGEVIYSDVDSTILAQFAKDVKTRIAEDNIKIYEE